MNRLLFLLLSVKLLAEPTFVEISDTANLPLLSPTLQTRKTAKIALENGVHILCISDPETDLSAASVAVHAGSWSDPETYPGMAHFCEHMLFMGTKKYPDSNEFSVQIANFGGLANAFTAPDKTVYMFSCRDVGFPLLLDQFAHFFIDPIFDPSNIAREMHAVDQEFSMHKDHDFWRTYHVFKEMGNPEHPNHLFSTGNSQTLANIPRSTLQEWHKKHYIAENIRVAVISPKPLEELKSLAAAAFAHVPTGKKVPLPQFGSITSSQQRGHLISIEPVQERQILSLSWELPSFAAQDRSKSADLIAFVLAKKDQFSLSQKLKSESLIDEIHIDVSRHKSHDHPFFDVDLYLSNLGVQNKDLVIAYVFQALQNLKKSGIPETLFHEKNALAKLQYQYQNRVDAFSYITKIGSSLFDEDFASYPRQEILSDEYHPEMVQKVLDSLTPDACCMVFIAPQKKTKISYDKKEKWLQVPYAVSPVEEKQLAFLRAVEPHPDMGLPKLNPFTPTQFHLVENPGLGKVPVKIAESGLGVAYYVRSEEYETPEAAIHLQILSPEIGLSAKNHVLAKLYLDHITDHLEPILHQAAIAGIHSSFEITKGKLHLSLSGFSEKLPLLLKEIVGQMTLYPPKQEEFALYFARHEKDYINSTKILPARQAKEFLSSLIQKGKSTPEENLAALRSLSFEEFTLFHKKLFEKTYFEALFAGNLSLKTAESCWIDIVHFLGKSGYPKSQHSELKALHLPGSEGPFLLSKQTESQGNAAMLLIDEGDFSSEKSAAQKILASALKEPFFDTLRTKQKTGYLAHSSDLEFEERLYQYFLVQSNTHQPEDLLHRFELFLEDFRSNLSETVSQERFEILKKSAVCNLESQCRNLQEKSLLWNRLAFDEKENFSFVENKIAYIQNLSYDRFLALSEEFLARSNRKRLAILYTGQIPSPFSYSPVTIGSFTESVTYAPRPKTL